MEVEIELDDDSLKMAQQIAEETGRTVEQVIRDAIIDAGKKKEEENDGSEARQTEGKAGGSREAYRG